jgi:protein ImuB
MPLHIGGEAAAWPGRIPAPAPTRVFDPPLMAELVATDGLPVRVSGRGEVVAPPAGLRCAMLPGGGGAVVGWCGPWLHDVRWWDRRTRRRCARFQIVLDGDIDGDIACLVTIERGHTTLDAIY